MSMDHMDPMRRITYFGVTHTRGKRQMFGIRAIDRLKHMYVIGKTGVGKSTMLENMAIQDIQNGEGLIFVDPHGGSAEKLLDFIPQDRIQDVIYFAPFDTEFPVAFNIMENIGFDQRHHVVSNLMGVFERLWADAWSARMQYILQNTLLALLEYPDSTLLDVNRMLINKEFRKDVVEKITDPIVKSFWVEEFANYGDRYTQEATPAIQNKVGQLISNPLMRNIIAQPKSSFDLRKVMDEKKIFIANISKGRMGDANSTMIGSVLVVRAYLAAMSRAAEPAFVQKKLPPCYFYVDEFQNVVNKAFTNILSESRKYGLALTIANQYIAQMDEKETTSVKDAVFGNVGTTIVFKVGPLDAQELEPLFEPTFTIQDLVSLGVGQIYLTLSIDGITSPPFSSETIPPIEAPTPSYRNEIIDFSRKKYSGIRADVELFINTRQAEFPAGPPVKREGRGGFKAAPLKSPLEVLAERAAVRDALLKASQPSLSQPPSPPVTIETPVAAPKPQPPPPPPPPPQPPRREPPKPPREPQAEPKDALKAAIEAARAGGLAKETDARSPADIFRKKMEHREQRKEERRQHGQNREERGSNKEHQRKPDTPHRDEGRGAQLARDTFEKDEQNREAEISHEVLERVLRGDPDRQ